MWGMIATWRMALEGIQKVITLAYSHPLYEKEWPCRSPHTTLFIMKLMTSFFLKITNHQKISRLSQHHLAHRLLTYLHFLLRVSIVYLML